MHAYGRTLRQAGELRLLVLPVGDGHEQYCVVDGETPLATFAGAVPALAFFEALRTTGRGAGAGAEEERPPREGAGGVTDLAPARPTRTTRLTRLTRARRRAGGPEEPAGAREG